MMWSRFNFVQNFGDGKFVFFYDKRPSDFDVVRIDGLEQTYSSKKGRKKLLLLNL